MREVRKALRSLSAEWRFALAAIVLLSLTIGATTAVFAVARAVILRPLPFGAPDRVAMIWQRDLRRALPVIEVAFTPPSGLPNGHSAALKGCATRV